MRDVRPVKVRTAGPSPLGRELQWLRCGRRNIYFIFLHQQNGRVAVVLDVKFGLPITLPSPLCGCVTVRPLGCWDAGAQADQLDPEAPWCCGGRLLLSALERNHPEVADAGEFGLGGATCPSHFFH